MSDPAPFDNDDKGSHNSDTTRKRKFHLQPLQFLKRNITNCLSRIKSLSLPRKAIMNKSSLNYFLVELQILQQRRGRGVEKERASYGEYTETRRRQGDTLKNKTLRKRFISPGYINLITFPCIASAYKRWISLHFTSKCWVIQRYPSCCSGQIKMF